MGQTEFVQYLAIPLSGRPISAHATARRRLRSLGTWNHELLFDVEWEEAVNKPQLRDFHLLACYSYLVKSASMGRLKSLGQQSDLMQGVHTCWSLEASTPSLEK